MKTRTQIVLIITMLSLCNTLESQPKTFQPTRDKFGSNILVEQDTGSGMIARISGLQLNVSSYGYSPNVLNSSSALIIAGKINKDYQTFTGIESSCLRLSRATHRDDKWYVVTRQTVNGIPILGSEFRFAITRHGNVHTLQLRLFPNVAVPSTTPITDKQSSITSAFSAFSTDAGTAAAQIIDSVYLAIDPMLSPVGKSYNLVWVAHVGSPQSPVKMEYLVDALDGSIIKRTDLRKKAHISVNVNRMYWPVNHNGGTLSDGGYAGVTVHIDQGTWSGTTNSNGHWESPEFSGTHFVEVYRYDQELSGNHCHISNSATIHENFSNQPSNATINRSWATDETNVFHHVNWVANKFLGSPYYFSEMDYQMDAGVHWLFENGSADGTNIQFGTAGNGMWARASDIIYHEYTHNVLFHIYNGWINIGDNPPRGEDAAMDEGLADFFACKITSDETFGESVLPSVNDPVRHLQSPALTMTDFVENNSHISGQIIGGACWDLTQTLPGSDVLVFNALFNGSRNFADLANDIVAEDDDDDDLGNGTPHINDIRSAFYGRKIYFTSGPPAAPENLDAQTNPGDNHVLLSWSANAEEDLALYEVWRDYHVSEPEGWLAIGTTTGTSYVDDEFYYTHPYGLHGVHYKIRAKDNANNYSDYSNVIYRNLEPWTRMQALPLPTAYSLEQNFPNPFNPSTVIKYALPSPTEVRLRVFDMLGREVKGLVRGMQQAGFYNVTLNASDLPSGVYLYKLEAGQFQASRKLALVK